MRIFVHRPNQPRLQGPGQDRVSVQPRRVQRRPRRRADPEEGSCRRRLRSRSPEVHGTRPRRRPVNQKEEQESLRDSLQLHQQVPSVDP